MRNHSLVAWSKEHGEGPSVTGRLAVQARPGATHADKTREVLLDVLNVVELRGERVVDVDDDDLPVGLTLVEEGHDAENLDLLDLADVADLLADLADVERVVVASRLGLGVDLGRVLPRLGEGTVVPDVTLVREAVADEAELALRGDQRDVKSARVPAWDGAGPASGDAPS